MQPDPFKKTFVASAVISELQSSDIYLTVKARLFDLDANLNGVRVTSEFMSEIVENEDKYIGIPLCADVRGLIDNRAIGHMYDERTGEFHSTAIGSFTHFEIEVADGHTYLIGYARIMKRNKAVCAAIAKLFAENELKFSFEISCGSYSEDADGIIVIDRDERNFLEGAAVVTFPACEGAVAQQLVAELSECKGDENMDAKVKEMTAENAEAEVKAEEAKAKEAIAEEEKAEEQKPEEIRAEEKAEAAEEKAESSEETAEAKEEPKEEAPAVEEDESDEETACDDKKCADEESACDDKKKCGEEQHEASVAETKLAELIASLEAQVNELKTEIAEYRETLKKEPEVNESNPFIAEMTAPNKYHLLDPDDKTEVKNYTLI